MKRIQSTTRFTKWLDRLKDVSGRARVQARIQRLALGNPGQHRNLRHGVSELKLDVGPGYRVYYTERNEVWLSCCVVGTNPARATILSWPTNW